MIFMHRESREPHGFPADHRSESRLSIPRRGALQQSSSPLPQPFSSLNQTAAAVQKYSANGECLTLRLSHIWGAPHNVLNSPIRRLAPTQPKCAPTAKLATAGRHAFETELGILKGTKLAEMQRIE